MPGCQAFLPKGYDKLTTVVTVEHQEKKAEIRSGESIKAMSSIRVQSDQDWHFDSLQEVLRIEMSGQQSETHGHVIEHSFQTDPEITQER